jgi:2-dehydro-3-deoxygluconokinase
LVRPLVERCNLLLAGAGELEEILGAGKAGKAGSAGGSEALAVLAAKLGPREVVVRDATAVGALAAGEWREIAIRRGDAVDPVGAGDAFNAGYIAVRLRGGSIDEALKAGVHCGAAVTAASSDTAGFPRALRF